MPKNIFTHKALLSVNVYIPPYVAGEAVNMLYYDLIPTLTLYTTDCFICVSGDFNQATIHPLRVFGLHDIVKFTARWDNKLDHLLVSNESFYITKKRAPLSTSTLNLWSQYNRPFSQNLWKTGQPNSSIYQTAENPKWETCVLKMWRPSKKPCVELSSLFLLMTMPTFTLVR